MFDDSDHIPLDGNVFNTEVSVVEREALAHTDIVERLIYYLFSHQLHSRPFQPRSRDRPGTSGV
jgi:hypothetical protein